MKTYADNKHNAKPSNIAIGDTVLHQNQGTKFTTRYQSRPFKVIQRKGNRVTAKRNGKYITRNVSFFKNMNVHPILRAERKTFMILTVVRSSNVHKRMNHDIRQGKGIESNEYLRLLR